MSLVETDVSYLGNGLNPWLIASHLTGWLAALGLIVLGHGRGEILEKLRISAGGRAFMRRCSCSPASLLFPSRAGGIC